jgi:hypothetical protein
MKRSSRIAAVSLALISALGLIARAGATSTTTTTAPSYGLAYLCDVLPQVDQLIVTRHAPGSHFRFAFPARVTATNASLVRRVAVAACALPTAPKGEHCAAEIAVSYTLNFVVDRDFIVVNPTGCETVSGLGPVRTTAEHHTFFRLLGAAMGLKHASYFTFAGIVELG